VKNSLVKNGSGSAARYDRRSDPPAKRAHTLDPA